MDNQSAAAGAMTLAGILLTIGLTGLIIAIISIVGMWKVFTKAGRPGWASIIPFYNAYVLCEIAGKPGWWFLLIHFVPILNIVVLILVLAGLARNFGKGTGFVFGLFFLPLIFFPVLGFGSSTYQPVAS